MRKISRYTKLLIVSTLLTASFGLTTEAVRSQPVYPQSHYGQGLYDQFERLGDEAKANGYQSIRKGRYSQAISQFRQAVRNYNQCLQQLTSDDDISRVQNSLAQAKDELSNLGVAE